MRGQCLGWGQSGHASQSEPIPHLTRSGHWVTAREMARSILECHFGTPEIPGAGPTSGLGFYTIQNIATIQAGSGIITGIPDNGP
jgi:hypothetical protein